MFKKIAKSIAKWALGRVRKALSEMPPSTVVSMARRLNAVVDIPGIDEGTEEKWLVRSLNTIIEGAIVLLDLVEL